MNYRLIDLIDIELLQAIINRFSDVTGIATTIIDHNGAIITVPAGSHSALIFIFAVLSLRSTAR